MNRSIIILATVVVGILYSCQSQESSSVETKSETTFLEDTCFHLDMPKVLNQTKEVFLSDLARSIKYVPLETTNEYLIGDKTVNVKPCAEYIFISEHGKPIGVFDLDGNFLYTIGKIGKGPGEYNFDYAFWPDESTRRIYVTNTNVRAISSYSFDGEHLGEIQTEVHSMTFVPLGNDCYLSWTFRQQDHNGQLYRLFFHDSQGSIFSRVFEPEKEYDFSRGVIITSPHFTHSPTGVLYNSWEDELIYRAKADGRFEPALSWSLGKLKLPFDLSSDYNRYLRVRQNYVLSINAWESEQNWCVQYNYRNHLEFAILNKESRECHVIANPDNTQEGVYNDIDGGPSFWPSWYSDKGKRFFRLLQAIDLLDEDFAPKIELEVRDPKAAEAFHKIVSSIHENSNPVLMIVELK